MNTFDIAWETLAEQGHCDAIGSMEYMRLRTLWEAEGEMLTVLLWIRMSSSHPLVFFSKTTSQDAPGTTNADPCG